MFFSQHTRELECEESIPSRPIPSAGASYTHTSSVQKSHDYFKAQVTSMVLQFSDTRTAIRDKYDLLGVTTPGRTSGEPEAELAGAILNALTQMQAKKSPPTLNFPTNVRFFNQIIYFKDLPDELDADVRLPQTAIPILGKRNQACSISCFLVIRAPGTKFVPYTILGDVQTLRTHFGTFSPRGGRSHQLTALPLEALHNVWTPLNITIVTEY